MPFINVRQFKILKKVQKILLLFLYIIMSVKPLVVVIGQTGSGKSHLLNTLCNSQLPTDAGGESTTQMIWKVSSAYGNGFDAYDTPGFGNDRNKLHDAAAIVGALTNEKVSRILVVVKFDKTPTMKKSLEVSLKPVIRYLELVTIVVTHWDQSQKKDQNKQELETLILSCFGIKSLLFSRKSKRISGESLCQEIDGLLTVSIPIQITSTEFSSAFDLIEEKRNYSKQKMDEDFTEFQKVFEALASKFRYTIELIYQKDPDIDEILHALTIWIKKEAENKIENFQMSHSTTMNELFVTTNDPLFSYLYGINLKRLINQDLQKCIDMAQRRMIIKPDHPFNRIKQCPHCKLIWLKVAGCDGNTTCGAYPSKQEENEIYPHVYNNYTRYQIQETADRITYTKQEVQQNIKTLLDQSSQNLKGCGKTITWWQLPLLDKDLLKELMDAGILDFLCEKRQEPAEPIKKYNEITQDAIKMAQNQIQQGQVCDPQLVTPYSMSSSSSGFEMCTDDLFQDNYVSTSNSSVIIDTFRVQHNI